MSDQGLRAQNFLISSDCRGALICWEKSHVRLTLRFNRDVTKRLAHTYVQDFQTIFYCSPSHWLVFHMQACNGMLANLLRYACTYKYVPTWCSRQNNDNFFAWARKEIIEAKVHWAQKKLISLNCHPTYTLAGFDLVTFYPPQAETIPLPLTMYLAHATRACKTRLELALFLC
jgi:hypothetical protein